MKKLCLILLLFALPIIYCGPKTVNGVKRSKASFTYKGDIKPGSWLRDLKVFYTVDGKEQFVSMQIYFPKSYTPGQKLRTIIALPGYNESLRAWEIETPIAKQADEYKLAIVCPNMKTTVYETHFYPETKNKWAEIPGGKFIAINLINYLRETFNLAADKNYTGILGAQMGARGALLVTALHTNDIGAAAGLSGIYDMTLLARDYHFVSVYGDYSQFKQRWATDDNLLKLAVNLQNTPVYIWHGLKDFTILPEQSMIMAIKLRQYNNITYVQHDHSIEWRYIAYRALPDVMKFFNEKLKL